jgi:hypothetical protein
MTIFVQTKLDDMKFYNKLLGATLLGGGFSLNVMSQQMPMDWASSMPGTGGDSGKDIVTDASGNVILLGEFANTVDFQPGAGTTNLTSAGSGDGSVAKYDTDGNLIWAVRFGGTGNDVSTSIDVDNSGNIYVCGYFNAAGDFDPGVGTTTLTPVGGNDAFILKLDQNGLFVWAKQIGGTNEDAAMALEVDASGNVVIGGFYSTTVDFDPNAGTVNSTSAGGNDGYILKLNSAGNFVWRYTFGSTSNDEARAIITDASGNAYVTGYFNGTVDFDFSGATQNLTGVSEEIFVLKVASGGTYTNAISMGSTGADSGRGIDVDSNGDIIVSGYFSGTVDFDSGAGTTNKTSNGGHDIFVQKLTNSLSHVWTSTAGGISDDQAWSAETDEIDNVFLAGFFRNTADFDPGTGTQNVTVSGGGVFADQFYWKLDTDGNYVFANKGGSTNNDHSLAFYPSGDAAYITGYLQGTSDYDFDAGVTNLSSAGSGDIYLVKYYNCNPINTNDVIVSCGPITWIDGNTYSSDNNTATHTLTSVNGCDSTVHLNLIIKSIDDKNAVASETNLCDGGSINVDVQNSQVGVFYTLVDQSTSTVLDGPTEGNGGTLTFDGGTISTTTIYEVQAERNRYNSLTFLGNSTTPTYVSCGNEITSQLAGTNNLTVEAWVNTNSTAPLQTIVGNYEGPMQFLLRLEPDLTARMWISNGVFNFVNSTTVLTPGTWYHIAATWDGAEIKMYVNGVLESTSVCTGTFPDISNDVEIGGGLSNDTEYFNGDLTGIRIWNTVRSETEIADNMDECISGNENGLFAMYNMVDGTGSTTVTDQSINGYDGTLVNMDANTSWNYADMPAITCAMCYSTMNEMPKVVVTSIADETVTPDQSTFCDNGTATISTGTSTYGLQYVLRDDSDDSVIDGPIAGDGSNLDFSTGSISSTTSYNVYAESIENSIEFDGVFSEVVVPGIDVSNASFTIEFWGRRNSNTGQDYFVGQGTGTTNGGLHIGFRPTNEFTFAFWFNDLNTPPVTDFNWHHWAMTYNATTNERIIYQDGIIVASDVATADYNGTGDLYLGDTPWGGSNLGGNLDEFRIWNGVRTENQINNNMNACLEGNESNLIAYYKFDELAGTSTVTDITSNGYDGTLASFDVNTAWQTGATSCGCTAEMTDVVTITINNSNTGTDVQAACDSYTWIDGNTYSADNNTAQFTVMNIAGCDSVVTLNLTIAASPIAGSVNNGDGTLSATGTGTYQWIDCGTNTAVAGATSASFIPTANGDYAVVVTSGSCDDTSACVTYNSVGLNENNSQSISVYPNPTQGNLVINLGNGFESGILQITNSIGQVVYVQEIDGVQTLDLNLEQANGIYMVTIFSNGEVVASTRIIKQ